MGEAPRKKYIDWIDTLKGFGILLVVIGHNKPGPFFREYLQLVMIPVFFFASGFVFNPDKYATYKELFVRRKEGLIKPYFYFGFISLAYWMVFTGGVMYINDQFRAGAIFLAIVPILGLFWGTAKGVAHNLPLWFLTCMFVSDYLYYHLRKKVPEPKKLLLYMFLISFGGFVYGKISPLRLPWSSDIACSVMVYYGAGHLFRQRYGTGWDLALWQKIPLAAALLAFGLWINYIGPEAHPSGNDLGRYFLFHLAGMTSVFAFLFASQILRKSSLLNWIGKNSLTILCIHVMGMATFLPIARHVFQIPVKETHGQTEYALFYAAGTLLLCWPAVTLINRYAPWLIGRKKVSQTTG